ncbi:MAG: ATP-dependent zinc metalloprotease FtsH [Oscillospiraceae bacterium]|jgi:cell division protease FtsH|nr:ATP-dependent zinc metalloprotease FtsH [Oscillospiraceae bacterium]MCI8715155.1 ATP-dependent zinc metalloprotease FtsH [Oscillospiraceae bacterium]
MGIYFALIVLLLAAYYFLYGSAGTSAISFAQVETLFEKGKVTSFSIRDGNDLYLNLQDGTTVHNELGSTDLFWSRLGPLIQEQKRVGILADYDHAPTYMPPWWMEILLYVAVIGAIFLVWQFMMVRAQGGGGGMDQGRRFGRARIRYGSDSKDKVSFTDVAGADEEKEELREIVSFLQEPKRYLDLGARIPKGVLLVGPPGTGKTLLAKAVAGEAGVQFLSISGSDFVELYVGVGASRVRDLFDEAKKAAPSVVFIDEIDAVGRQRGAGLGGGHDEREQTLNQLLVEMDGFSSNEGVVVLAATNRADILDPALLRPGRFDRQVFVGRPDSKGRAEILAVHARNKPLAEDVDLKVLAQSTSGFTGADLENVINEGALLAARKNEKFITMDSLQEAVIKVIAGPEKKSRVVPEHERRLTAYHEAGHAVMHHCLESVDPVHQVTIVPRGQAGGMTISLPGEDRGYYSKRYMEEEIAALLGGRVAESLFLDDISTGASNDIQRASAMARKMVTTYGMSQRLGAVSFDSGHDEVFIGRSMAQAKTYSEEVAAQIDGEVKAIIDAAYRRCQEVLEAHRSQMEAVASYLLEHETMSGEDFTAVMGFPKAALAE